MSKRNEFYSQEIQACNINSFILLTPQFVYILSFFPVPIVRFEALIIQLDASSGLQHRKLVIAGVFIASQLAYKIAVYARL